MIAGNRFSIFVGKRVRLSKGPILLSRLRIFEVMARILVFIGNAIAGITADIPAIVQFPFVRSVRHTDLKSYIHLRRCGKKV